MIVFAALLTLWTAAAAAAGLILWRRLTTHRKVYGLIVLHGLYAAGVYVLYGWVRGGLG